MDRYEKLEQIANSIYAAGKIRDLSRKNTVRNSSAQDSSLSRASIMHEMLKIIAEHSPAPHNNTLSEAVYKSGIYGEVYRNMKQHLRSNLSRGISKDGFIKTLHIVKPVLNEKQRGFVEKIMKIYEILQSD